LMASDAPSKAIAAPIAQLSANQLAWGYCLKGARHASMELNDGRRALSVFSFEEEARLFQRLGTRGGWWVRETGVGKLLSVLYGPCREVELVALDPLPQREAEAVNRLLCVDRDRFVGFLQQKRSGH
jgi:hypothetical protein